MFPFICDPQYGQRFLFEDPKLITIGGRNIMKNKKGISSRNASNVTMIERITVIIARYLSIIVTVNMAP